MIALKCNECGGKLGYRREFYDNTKNGDSRGEHNVHTCGHCAASYTLGELELFRGGEWVNDGKWFEVDYSESTQEISK